MKKLLLVLVAVLGISFAANAQMSGKAIGVRLGGGTGYGGEISYQMPVGNNRAELDFGYSSGEYLNFAGIYQWTGNITGDFGWFVGPGVNVGYCLNHGLGLAALVQGGVDWCPQGVPFQISLDVRPSFDFLMDKNCAYNGFGYGFALGLRYIL